MTPIEKNESTIKTVFVVDEQGNKYEATYPKRAKGLVKNGRARFVDEKTICLACPPDKFMEDKIMEVTEIKNENLYFKDIAEIANKPEENNMYADITGKPGKNYTIDYALSQLESIRIEEKEFTSTISGILSGIQIEYPDDVTGQAKVAAVGEMVKAHSENTSRLMNFYIDMIEKIRNSSAK